MAKTPSTSTSTTERGGGAKSARTRKRILDAAAYVLSRKGYAGTRLADVAARAKIQAPPIYYYFSSREDLLEEVMWTGIARTRDYLEQVLDQMPADSTAMSRINAAVAAHLRYVLEISDYATASIRNGGQFPEERRARYQLETTKYRELWLELIHQAKSAGELRPGVDPGLTRMLIIGALSWAAEWWHPERGSLDDLIRAAQSLVNHGLAVEPDTD